MRGNGLRARWRRKFVHTTDSPHVLPVSANLLARPFNPEAPNRAWVCDITYVRTCSGWLYLVVVLDLFSRRVGGWSTAPNMHAQLVCAALNMAIANRQPPVGLTCIQTGETNTPARTTSLYWHATALFAA